MCAFVYLLNDLAMKDFSAMQTYSDSTKTSNVTRPEDPTTATLADTSQIGDAQKFNESSSSVNYNGNKRLQSLPLYVFAQLDKLKKDVRESGLSLIDLGMGNPDMPTPPEIIDALAEAIRNPENHGYPSFDGKATFREAVSQWMQRRYLVTIDPSSQVQPLIGSKEGIANLITATLEPGDVCLVPSLYYPTYMRSTVMTGAEAYYMPLLAENGYLPDLDAIPKNVLSRAKILLLNYPNNPTGVDAPPEFYKKAIAFAKEHHIILATDMAYGEVNYDGFRPHSIMEFEGADEVAIEFHSFSKTFNMAGWRLGFAIGAPSIIRLLYLNKTTSDYGVCNAIQDAGTYALDHAEMFITPMIERYQARRDYLVDAMAGLGFKTDKPKSSFYLWYEIPKAFDDSFVWSEYLMRETGVVVTPGGAFGEDGTRYFRVSLVSPMESLQAAIHVMTSKGVSFTMAF